MWTAVSLLGNLPFPWRSRETAVTKQQMIYDYRNMDTEIIENLDDVVKHGDIILTPYAPLYVHRHKGSRPMLTTGSYDDPEAMAAIEACAPKYQGQTYQAIYIDGRGWLAPRRVGEMVTIKQAAALAGISHQSIFYHIHSGHIKSQMIGGRHLLRRCDVKQFIRRRRDKKRSHQSSN